MSYAQTAAVTRATPTLDPAETRCSPHLNHAQTVLYGACRFLATGRSRLITALDNLLLPARGPEYKRQKESPPALRQGARGVYLVEKPNLFLPAAYFRRKQF